MTLPSAPNSISMSQVNTELGRSSTASINLNETAVRTLAGVASGTISMDNLRGKTAFTLAFNNAENISLSDRGQPSTYQATYTLNRDATCSKYGLAFGLDLANGPTAWGTPTGGTPGDSFEARLNVTSYSSSFSGGDYVKFAGVNISGSGFTSWYSLSSARAIDAVGSNDISFVEGTLYIRNTSTLTEISRTFAVYADPTY